MSDALGELTSLTDEALTIATRSGAVTVPRQAVVAAKRVPAAPVTRREIIALERAADEAWPAPVRERLGDWLLRASAGWTGRGNSALPIGDPGVPLPEAIERVREWYAARGLPALINVPLPLAAPLDAALDARGWERLRTTLVQTAPLAAVRAAGRPRSDLPPVELADAPTPEWLDLAAVRKGALPAAADHLLTTGGQVPVRFAHVRDGDGTLLAAGRGSVTGGGRWLGIMQIEVIPAARRRGLARHLIAALAGWAAEAGASDAFLQVEEVNQAGIALYRGLGFTTHHRYITRGAPSI